MNSTNAYQTPETIPFSSVKPTVMYWFAGLMFVSLMIGGIIGATGGAMIGSLAPGYYRSVVSFGKEPDFDPFQFGIAVGAIQGAGVGLLIGMVSIFAFIWYRSRAAAASRASS